LGSTLAGGFAHARTFNQDYLQVWSCGGLAEAFGPANRTYEEKTGGQDPLTQEPSPRHWESPYWANARTEVFAGRGLALSKKLRQAGKMTYFKPLCFTSYVVVTPKGNPAGIRKVEDLAGPGVRVVLAPQASPPGGEAVEVLLKKAGSWNRP